MDKCFKNAFFRIFQDILGSDIDYVCNWNDYCVSIDHKSWCNRSNFHQYWYVIFTLDKYLSGHFVLYGILRSLAKFSNLFEHISMKIISLLECSKFGRVPREKKCLDSFSRKLNPIWHFRPHSVDYIMKYVFISPEYAPYMKMEECSGENIKNTCGVNVDVIRDLLLPRNCSAIIFNINYKIEYIGNCDDIFKLQQTEIGSCFTANGVYF